MLATDELIRKATTTTTQVQPLIPQIWAAQLERNLRKRAVFEQSAVVNSDLLAPNAGDTVYIPIWPDLAAAVALTEGTDMPLTTMSNATSVALAPKEFGTTVEITRKALDRMKYDGMSATMDRLAYAMSQAIEGSFAALYSAVVPGTATKLDDLYPNGHASTTIVAGDIFSDKLMLAGIADLQGKNNIPFDDGYWRLYITPTQWEQLLEDQDTRQDLRWAAPQRLLNGEVGVLHGCRIIVTNYVPSSGSGQSYAPADEGASSTIPVNKALLLAPRAMAVAYKRRPEVVVDPTLYDMGRRRRFGVVADFDIELIHAERGVVLTSSQS
jgi:N4-gp56 family major capsid protein